MQKVAGDFAGKWAADPYRRSVAQTAVRDTFPTAEAVLETAATLMLEEVNKSRVAAAQIAKAEGRAIHILTNQEMINVVDGLSDEEFTDWMVEYMAARRLE